MGLGKGLGALLPELGEGESKTLLYCGIEEIIPESISAPKTF